MEESSHGKPEMPKGQQTLALLEEWIKEISAESSNSHRRFKTSMGYLKSWEDTGIDDSAAVAMVLSGIRALKAEAEEELAAVAWKQKNMLEAVRLIKKAESLPPKIDESAKLKFMGLSNSNSETLGSASYSLSPTTNSKIFDTFTDSGSDDKIEDHESDLYTASPVRSPNRLDRKRGALDACSPTHDLDLTVNASKVQVQVETDALDDEKPISPVLIDPIAGSDQNNQSSSTPIAEVKPISSVLNSDLTADSDQSNQASITPTIDEVNPISPVLEACSSTNDLGPVNSQAEVAPRVLPSGFENPFLKDFERILAGKETIYPKPPSMLIIRDFARTVKTKLPLELVRHVGEYSIDPKLLHGLYMKNQLPSNVSWGVTKLEVGKSEALKSGDSNVVKKDFDLQIACIPTDRPTYDHYIVYRSGCFEVSMLLDNIDIFKHAKTIQFEGCRNTCWRSIVHRCLSTLRGSDSRPLKMRLTHFVDETFRIPNIDGATFTLLYVYLGAMTRADMISLKSIFRKIRKSADIVDLIDGIYHDVEDCIMDRFRLPGCIFEMAFDGFDIRNANHPDKTDVVRFNGFSIETAPGVWQLRWENHWRHFSGMPMNDSWNHSGALVWCRNCHLKLPALFAFDDSEMRNGEDHDNALPRCICRICKTIFQCGNSYAAEARSYKPAVGHTADNPYNSPIAARRLKPKGLRL